MQKAFATQEMRDTWAGLGAEAPNLVRRRVRQVRRQRDQALGRGREVVGREAGLTLDETTADIKVGCRPVADLRCSRSCVALACGVRLRQRGGGTCVLRRWRLAGAHRGARAVPLQHRRRLITGQATANGACARRHHHRTATTTAACRQVCLRRCGATAVLALEGVYGAKRASSPLRAARRRRASCRRTGSTPGRRLPSQRDVGGLQRRGRVPGGAHLRRRGAQEFRAARAARLVN